MVSTSKSQQLAVIASKDLPLVTLQSDVSAELNGVKLKDRNLIAEHLEQFYTTAWANNYTDITFLNNCSTIGNFMFV
jgi:hypothetical protein